MGGSLDDQNIEVVDTRETVLALLVYPNGDVRFQSSQPKAWVAETLQRITDTVKADVAEENP